MSPRPKRSDSMDIWMRSGGKQTAKVVGTTTDYYSHKFFFIQQNHFENNMLITQALPHHPAPAAAAASLPPLAHRQPGGKEEEFQWNLPHNQNTKRVQNPTNKIRCDRVCGWQYNIKLKSC